MPLLLWDYFFRAAWHFWAKSQLTDVPEAIDISWPFVAIIDVIGVFPNVDGQERFLAVFQRSVGIAEAEDFQLAFWIGGQPGPAGAEEFHGGFGHGFFEVIDTAEVALMAAARSPAGLPPPLGFMQSQ